MQGERSESLLIPRRIGFEWWGARRAERVLANPPTKWCWLGMQGELSESVTKPNSLRAAAK